MTEWPIVIGLGWGIAITSAALLYTHVFTHITPHPTHAAALTIIGFTIMLLAYQADKHHRRQTP